MEKYADRLKVHIPEIEDLWFRQKMMSDKKTMNYNMGFEPYKGYNPNDGTILFPKENWQKWFNLWWELKPPKK